METNAKLMRNIQPEYKININSWNTSVFEQLSTKCDTHKKEEKKKQNNNDSAYELKERVRRGKR